MALISQRTDDLDGSLGARPFTFSLDGRVYNIDLGDENIARLLDLVAEFVTAATPAARGASTLGRPPQSKKSQRRSSFDRGYDLKKLRQWAAVNSIVLPHRGRVPGAIAEQFMAWEHAQLASSVASNGNGKAKASAKR